MRRPDPLLGRDVEIAHLDGLVRACADGGATVLVLGEPGVGKSALIATVAADAAARGVLVLKTAGVRSESHLPFAGLHQLVQPIVRFADDLAPPHRDALNAAFGTADGVVGDHFGVALAMLTLLRDRASESPILLVVDDVHWLDRPTADVVAFVARRIEDDPIVLICSSRDTPTGALADAGLQELPLDGLDAPSAERLVDAHAPDLDRVLRDRLLQEARGNALALVELSIAWSRLPPGTLIASWVPVTTRLTRTFASRVETLPAACRTVLLVAAVNDGESIAEALEAASLVVGRTVGHEELASAVGARLVELDAGVIRFRHPLVRTVIHESAGPPERRAAHAALAGVLADEDRVAWHRAANVVVPDEEVAAALERAAVRARQRGAIGVAIAALERAANLSPQPASRGRRLVRAAELAVELGRQDVIQRLLDEAEPLTLDPLDRVRAEWRRAMLGEGVWRDVAHLQSLVDITDRMSRAHDVDMALEAMLAIAAAGWWTSFDEERRRLVVAAAERLPVAEHDPRLLGVLALAAPVERGATVLGRLGRLSPIEVDEPGAQSLLGTAAGVLGDHACAADYLDPSIRRLRADGRLGALAPALVSRAWASWHLSSWDTAAATAQEARRLGEQTERPAVIASAQLVEAALAAVRGDVADAEATVRRVEAFYRPLGAATMLALAALVHGMAALAQGRPDEAYERLRPLFGAGDHGAATIIGQGALATFVDAAVGSGHRDDARTVIAEFEQLAARCGSPTMRVAIAYAGPLIADDDRAETRFASALRSEVAGWPFLHGRLLLAHGTWLRRRRRVSESRPPLRVARDTFDMLGAAPWGERARQELRATGEASTARHVDTAERLTAQEAEVVRLAAKGMTNREIGQLLFLSPRTVGSHLYRVFPKLGITSRSELAGVIASQS